MCKIWLVKFNEKKKISNHPQKVLFTRGREKSPKWFLQHEICMWHFPLLPSPVGGTQGTRLPLPSSVAHPWVLQQDGGAPMGAFPARAGLGMV